MSEISKKIDSIEKLAKEAERLAKNLQGNPFSVFDRIAKDIQEQKDNAIAMEFIKCIGELLRKNGVVPKITEYTRDFETDNTFETRYGVSIDELDFSEHDKVFEDKIAELKKDYKTVSELLGKYQQENESLKKRIIELENFSCQAEQETESLFEKLKQRIAGLEKELEEWKEEARVVKKQRDEQLKSFRKGIEPYVDLLHMHETIAELKQHIDELESKESEVCKNEPKISDSTPSMEWYENRHQSDCIEINRLNTTIDVLIHKVEYLRQFAGLE